MSTKPYQFVGFGAMDVTKPYKFIRFGATDVDQTLSIYKVWEPSYRSGLTTDDERSWARPFSGLWVRAMSLVVTKSYKP